MPIFVKKSREAAGDKVALMTFVVASISSFRDIQHSDLRSVEEEKVLCRHISSITMTRLFYRSKGKVKADSDQVYVVVSSR